MTAADPDAASFDPRLHRLIAEIVSRNPVDERERRSIERFVDEIDRLDAAGLDPFDEHATPVHVTASAIVTGPRGVVLHLHRRLGTWLQPGGHVDHGEMPWDAAAREAREETGLVVTPFDVGPDGIPRIAHVDVHDGPRGHLHLDVRYRYAADGNPAPAPGESPDVEWFGWTEALERADPGLSGIIADLVPR